MKAQDVLDKLSQLDAETKACNFRDHYILRELETWLLKQRILETAEACAPWFRVEPPLHPNVQRYFDLPAYNAWKRRYGYDYHRGA